MRRRKGERHHRKEAETRRTPEMQLCGYLEHSGRMQLLGYRTGKGRGGIK
jgi:hypothetical protein